MNSEDLFCTPDIASVLDSISDFFLKRIQLPVENRRSPGIRLSRVKLADKIPEPKTSVTIAIMHYERPHMLQDAVASVCNLSCPVDQVIICDDCSNSKEAIDLLDRLSNATIEVAGKGVRVEVFRQEKNAYLGALRNLAVMHATSDWVFFLDDDNYLHSEAVQYFKKAVKSTPHIKVVGTHGLVRFAEDNLDFLGGRLIPFTGSVIFSRIHSNLICDGNAFVNIDAFKAVGGNSEYVGIGKDDLEFFIRIASHFGRESIAISPDPLIIARQNLVRLRSKHLPIGGLVNERVWSATGVGSNLLDATILRILFVRRNSNINLKKILKGRIKNLLKRLAKKYLRYFTKRVLF